MGWQPIETAPKDGSVLLVNDTTDGGDLWVAAKWLSAEDWSGWIYDNELVLDSNPKGPEPTHWFPLPPLPSNAETRREAC